jgi:hypothetical protein
MERIDADYKHFIDEEFPTIDTTRLWSNLKMEDDLDDDTLLIELHCLIISKSKVRFTKDTVIDEIQYTDETTEKGKQYIDNQLHPGPNHTHAYTTRTKTILSGYNKLAQKYGQGHFDNFIRNLYRAYPTPDQNISVMEYLTQLKEGRPQFHMKWAYIYDFMYSINAYFESRGEILE